MDKIMTGDFVVNGKLMVKHGEKTGRIFEERGDPNSRIEDDNLTGIGN
jgi:hypothetical protein